MSDTGRLFAKLTGELEDLHGLAVEGQAAGQPKEVLHALADSLVRGVERTSRTLLHIRLSIDPDG